MKSTVDLRDWIAKDLGEPKRVSGKYSFWVCPFHADKDPSFGVTYDRYYCFSCSATGDVIDWLRKTKGYGFKEALAVLSGETKDLKSVGTIVERQKPKVEPVEPEKPDLQSAWKEIIETCRAKLWTNKGEGARKYLMARGIKEDTMQSPFINLGYSEGERIADIWVDKGIVIPCFTVDRSLGVKDVSYIKIRRGRSWVYRPKDKAKYRKLYGAKAGLYGADLVRGSDIVFVTEGELDALLLGQEVGKYVGVCTLGGSSDKLDWSIWGEYLSFTKQFYIAYDNDRAGQSGLERWQEMTGRAIYAEVPEGKDITDAWRAGVNLEDWIFSLINNERI